MENIEKWSSQPYYQKEHWDSESSHHIYKQEVSSWKAKEHPTRSSKGHHILNDGHVDIQWKPEDGPNELFLELLYNRIASSLGLHVTPTAAVVFDGKVGIGSVDTSTGMLSPVLYNEFIRWEDNSFVAEQFVFNIWLANNDWGVNNYGNSYAITMSSSGAFVDAYGIDFGNTIFCPAGNFDEVSIGKLSNTFTIGGSERNFFGYEIFFKHIKKGLGFIDKIESIKDSRIYLEAKSIARLLEEQIPIRRKQYHELALASARVLIERKNKLRNWIMNNLISPNINVIL
ncbi:MAG: hypothetical protein HYW62_03570 [Candidatus Levybacteria bacterium]|nr:hypothetical protein [Candidatus Levybacteria bacterium]